MDTNYKTKKTTKPTQKYTKNADKQLDLFGFSILGIASELDKQSIDAPEFNPRALHEPKSSLNVNAPAFQPVLALNPNAKEYSPSKLNVNAEPFTQHYQPSYGATIPGNENYYYGDVSNDSSTTWDSSSSAVSYEPPLTYSSTAFYQHQEEAETNQIGYADYDAGYSSNTQNKHYSESKNKSSKRRGRRKKRRYRGKQSNRRKNNGSPQQTHCFFYNVGAGSAMCPPFAQYTPLTQNRTPPQHTQDKTQVHSTQDESHRIKPPPGFGFNTERRQRNLDLLQHPGT